MSTSPITTNAPTRCDRRPAAQELLTAAWDRDWQRLRHDPAAQRRLLAWSAAEPLCGEFHDLAELLDATGRGRSEDEADATLAAVLRLARADDLAARLTLQRLLPGLVAIAARRAASGRWQVRPLFDELVAAAWLVLRTFPYERRGRRIAANLLRDVEYQVCVRPFRLRSSSEVPIASEIDDVLDDRTAGLDGRSDERGRHPGEELTELLTNASLVGLDPADLELLRALYLDSEPVSSVAERLSVSPRTVLNRRRAATARLRDAAA
jgi:hypothetical protein